MARKTRPRPHAKRPSEKEVLAIQERAVKEAAESAAKLKADLITLREAAELLSRDEPYVLELAFNKHFSIATVSRSERPFFLDSDEIHPFIADPGRKVMLHDLRLYPEPLYQPDIKVPPSPIIWPLEPDSDVSIHTLRVLRTDVLRLRGELAASGKKEPAPRAESKRGIAHFDTPANATWGDVGIKFVDGHTVSVSVLGVKGRFNYTDMGMADHRTANPNRQWELLGVFADGHGTLDWSNRDAGRDHKHHKKRLAETLRKFFGIDDDPFGLTDDRKGWTARFRILPDR